MLARGQRPERGVGGAVGEQGADDLGVHHRAARGDLADGGDELADVHDPVLEQVAHRSRAVRQQFPGVELLDVLREHQMGRPGIRWRASIAARRPSSVKVGGSRTSTMATSGRCVISAWISAGPLSTACDDLEAGGLGES